MTARLCLALLFAAAGYTQPARENWNTLAALIPGTEIRITRADGKTVRGFFQSATPEAILVNARTSQEVFPRAGVKRVHLKRPGHRGRNTLIGLAAGAGTGLAAGAAFDSRATIFFDHFGKAVLTSCGAIFGTVIGVAWPTGRWREVYRAP